LRKCGNESAELEATKIADADASINDKDANGTMEGIIMDVKEAECR
jgi:hypothetical protein